MRYLNPYESQNLDLCCQIACLTFSFCVVIYATIYVKTDVLLTIVFPGIHAIIVLLFVFIYA